MRKTLTDAEIIQYREDGYVLIQDFLHDDEVQLWRDIFIPAVKKRAEVFGSGTYGIGDGFIHQEDTSICDLLYSPEIGRLIGQLNGFSEVRLLNDYCYERPGHFRTTDWHVSMHEALPFHSRNCTVLWVSLQDLSARNGAICVLPGFPKAARVGAFEKKPGMAGIFDDYPEWRNKPTVSIDGRGGFACFYNALMPHATAANLTPDPRYSVLGFYFGPGEVYNGIDMMIRPEYAARLNIGDPIDDGNEAPVVWRAEG
jgi:hypothetical protein